MGLTDSFIKLLAMKLEPVNFRQFSQWHITRFMGSPVTSYWMPPQRQLPVMGSGVDVVEVGAVRSMVVCVYVVLVRGGYLGLGWIG